MVCCAVVKHWLLLTTNLMDGHRLSECSRFTAAGGVDSHHAHMQQITRCQVMDAEAVSDSQLLLSYNPVCCCRETQLLFKFVFSSVWSLKYTYILLLLPTISNCKTSFNGACSLVYRLVTQVYKQPAHKKYTLASVRKSQKGCCHLSKRALLKAVWGDTVTAGEMLPAVYGLDTAMSLSALWHSGDRCSLTDIHTDTKTYFHPCSTQWCIRPGQSLRWSVARSI